MKTVITVLVLVIFSITVIHAQDRVVYGVVHTLEKIPLTGVEIQIQSTKQKIYTDSLGNFAAGCNQKDKLKLRANGFYNQNIKIHENTKFVAVNLKVKPGKKQQDYAIGYGYVSEQDKTTSISNMHVTESDYAQYHSLYDIVRSMGAEVRNNEIIIRGTKSFQGSSAALIVVDGVISDYDHFSSLRPVEIKRIDILRDAAASIYGSRGANGVVLIETLKGK